MEIFCSVCGISGKMRGVFEVISPKGVIFACEKCVSEEGFPVLKKPDKKVFEESERKSSVYERLSRLSGIRHAEQQERPELKKQEESLRKVIDGNYEEKMRMQDLRLKSRPDLIDKFHWIIMRVRRVRGLTQKQLAEAINETEAAIKMAEQGLVPEGYGLIDKIQGFLNVRLIRERNLYTSSSSEKKETPPIMAKLEEKTRPGVVKLEGEKQSPQTYPQKTLSLDRKNVGSLTISDLRRMRQEKELEEEEKRENNTEE